MNSHTERKSSTYDIEALRGEWRELMYRIAATEYAEQEADAAFAQIEADRVDGKTLEADAHFAQTEAKTLRVIHAAVRRNRLRKFARQTLPQVGRVAVAAMLVFFIGFSVAIASVHSVRVHVLELLMHVEKEYTELSLRENLDLSFDVPVEWQGSYYPAQIPKGLSVVSLHNVEQDFSVKFYSESSKQTITFFEMGEDAYANLDTENSVATVKMVKGAPALFARKGQRTSMAWAGDNIFFMLICDDLEEDEVLAIANSVTRIKK